MCVDGKKSWWKNHACNLINCLQWFHSGRLHNAVYCFFKNLVPTLPTMQHWMEFIKLHAGSSGATKRLYTTCFYIHRSTPQRVKIHFNVKWWSYPLNRELHLCYTNIFSLIPFAELDSHCGWVGLSPNDVIQGFPVTRESKSHNFVKNTFLSDNGSIKCDERHLKRLWKPL